MLFLYIVLGIVGYLYMGRVTNKYLVPYLAEEGSPAYLGEMQVVIGTMIFRPFLFFILTLIGLGKLLVYIAGTPKSGGNN